MGPSDGFGATNGFLPPLRDAAATEPIKEGTEFQQIPATVAAAPAREAPAAVASGNGNNNGRPSSLRDIAQRAKARLGQLDKVWRSKNYFGGKPSVVIATASTTGTAPRDLYLSRQQQHRGNGSPAAKPPPPHRIPATPSPFVRGSHDGTGASTTLSAGITPSPPSSFSPLEPQEGNSSDGNDDDDPIGERLYYRIHATNPDMASRITGILLECEKDNPRNLLDLLEGPSDDLEDRIESVLGAIRAHQGVGGEVA